MTEITSATVDVPPVRPDWIRRILVGIVAAAAVIASFHAQSGLGELAGWHASLNVFGWRLSLSWLLPLCVDAYGATATLITVDAARYSEHTRHHALVHAIAAIVVGVLANAAYHLLAANVWHLGPAMWVLVVAVSIIPPVALGALAHLMALCARDDAAARARAVPAEVRPAPTVPAAAAAVPASPVRGAGDPAQEILGGPGLPLDEPGPYPPRTAAVPEAPATVPAGPSPYPGGAAPLRWSDLVARAAGEGQAQHVPADPADQAAVTDTGSFRAVPAEVPVPADVPEPVRQAIQTYAPLAAQGKLPPIAQIKRELKCGQPRAQEVRAYLAEYATT
ncbi:hypothetical protein ACGFIV_01050 [Sphaerisporangium sp. NPDC049003]|uniref:hypothetical protein n=1 Tax=Sphaerisporangium sp. NPDC049003 TaxID=3364517 RepID=UPI00371AD27D